MREDSCRGPRLQYLKIHWAAMLLARRVGKKERRGLHARRLNNEHIVYDKSCRIVAERSPARRSHVSSKVTRPETEVFLMQREELEADTCSINVATSWQQTASWEVRRERNRLRLQSEKNMQIFVSSPRQGGIVSTTVFLFCFNIPPFLPFPMQLRCGRTLSAAAETLAASSNNWFCNECGRPFKMERGKREKNERCH